MRILPPILTLLALAAVARADVASDIADLKAWQRHAESVAPALVVAPAAPTTRSIYVSSATGDDAADGSTDARPIKTWARACALATGDHFALLFRRGDTFAVDRGLTTTGTDVRFASYGDAGTVKPVLSLSVARNDLSILNVGGSNVSVEDLAFDSSVCAPGDCEKRNVANAVRVGGKQIAVRRCTFLNVMCGVTGDNQGNDGVIVDGCDAPLLTGLRAYLVYLSGNDWQITHNYAANSTREHIFRGGATNVVIKYNDVANVDRSQSGDPLDIAKSDVNLQIGGNYDVEFNVFRGGPVSVGPLGGADGIAYKANRVAGVVIANNRLIGSMIQVQHGTSDVRIANNLIAYDNAPAIAVYAYDPTYQRGVSNVVIDHNTVLNNATHGNFASIGAGAIGVAMTNNIYASPLIETGGWNTAALAIGETKSLTSVANNRWPTPAKQGWGTNGGVMLIGGQYVAPAAWAAIAPTDKVLPIAAGTIAIDGAGVDVGKLPAVVK